MSPTRHAEIVARSSSNRRGGAKRQVAVVLVAMIALTAAGCSSVNPPAGESAATSSAPSTTSLLPRSTTTASDQLTAGETISDGTNSDGTNSDGTDSAGGSSDSDSSGASGESTDPEVDDEKPQNGIATAKGELQLELLNTYPHDKSAFTQGLAFWGGHLIESTGLYGESEIRRYSTGEDGFSESQPLDDSLFGGGLAVVDNRLIQLTWRKGEALVRDPDTLDQTDFFTYAGEGWGLCYDGKRLVMGDGTDQLIFRDPTTFESTGSISVTKDGVPVTYLNELECVNGLVWANVWLSNEIVAIDPATSEVVAWVDASSIVPEGLAADDVLNGIAYATATDTWYLTGKHWDTIFEVRFVS